MQTATGTLTAAIQSKERTPVHVTRIDWARDGTFVFDPGIVRDVLSDTIERAGDMGDVSRWVESVAPSRSLSTDLPEAAKADTGFAAADATVVLAGALGGFSLPQLFSAYDNPMSTLVPRIGAPITVDMGMRGTAGVEVLRQFTGRVRGCSVDPASGNVTLTCIDNRERFRTPVVLRVVVRDDFGTIRPGLNAGWVLDYIARRQGFYQSPQQRNGCNLLATMHGSAQPEVGAMREAQQFTAGAALVGPVTFDATLASGVVGLVCYPNPNTTSVNYTPLAGMNVNNGSTIFVQAWMRGSANGALICKLDDNAATSFNVTMYAHPVANTVEVILQRGGLSPVSTTIAAAALTSGVEHYVAFHLAFTAAGCTINARVDGTTYTGTIVIAASTGNAGITKAAATNAAGVAYTMRDLQVTTEAFSASMWDNAFAPTAAFEASLNELTATPTVESSDPWQISQDIASSEQGIFGFDENGVLRFYNRNHLTGGAAVATLTTDPAVSFANIIARASDEQVDGIANYVTVGAVPHYLDPTNVVLWSATELLGVVALGALNISVELPGPYLSLSAIDYKAAKAADGTGGDVTNLGLYATQITTSVFVLTVLNPNAFDVFLVGNSTSGAAQGDPSVSFTGRCVRVSESGYIAVRQDSESQIRYGYQSLDVPASVWRQSTAAADGLATALLTALKDPHPTLGQVEIVPDVRLQLGDRARVADPSGLVLDADFWVTSIATRHSGSDTGQSVTLRAV